MNSDVKKKLAAINAEIARLEEEKSGHLKRRALNEKLLEAQLRRLGLKLGNVPIKLSSEHPVATAVIENSANGNKKFLKTGAKVAVGVGKDLLWAGKKFGEYVRTKQQRQRVAELVAQELARRELEAKKRKRRRLAGQQKMVMI
ncbi:MAG: hypothetical protein KGH64_01810 [Candidatus Micrarchaeota archaeon]|nr:hypothetical protein [Candidatus Micrarchaeota archaeon]MDE1834052.1 hypothetical protein [Candidatus Micrarchaeota archaeon]MDE1859181.1 hypothetical protein [Candidatus Micrarchaeota archaeon]